MEKRARNEAEWRATVAKVNEYPVPDFGQHWDKIREAAKSGNKMCQEIVADISAKVRALLGVSQGR